jgi:diguanylate cyclase (GGDEF)-like protein/PAS domain S-box-containing protein
MTRLRILHVDDTDSDRVLLARLIDRLDVSTELVHASSYEAGLDVLCRGEFDACLLDYRLGVHTGIELLRAARARDCYVPTLVLTGVADRAVDVEASEAGAFEFLAKDGLDPRILERALRYAIAQGRIQDALRRSQESFRALTDALPLAVVVHRQGDILYANPAALAQVGVGEASRVVGKRYSELVVPDSDPAPELPKSVARERRIRRLDGSEYVVELATLDLTFDGQPASLTIAHDITARREHELETERLLRQLAESNAKLLALSTTDELTALRNYRSLRAELDQEFRRARRTRQTLSVLMIDIDHFKHYNDRHGHEAGNVVLRGAAAILRASVREIDTLARYGGEEFCVVLPAAAIDEAHMVAERLRARIAAEPFAGAREQPKGHMSISIGVAELVDDDESPADLLRRADGALYQAKRSGRDRVEIAP